MYNVMDAKVYNQKVQTMATETAINRTATTSVAKLTLKYGVTKRRTWDSSVSLKLGVATTIQAGVPQVSSSSVKIEHEFTEAYNWGESISHTEEHSVEYEIPAPAYTKVTRSMMGKQGSCSVPFSYYREDIFVGPWIFGTGEPTTLTSVVEHTLWIEVGEGRKSAHTQHKHQGWPELCRGDGKTKLSSLSCSEQLYIYNFTHLILIHRHVRLPGCYSD